MTPSFFWYDYETFGRNPRWAGIAQFAGVRTDLDLNEIDKPLVLHCRPPRDSWPEPEACLITGITPQYCLEHGVGDAELARLIQREMARPNTCTVGFNNLRFDDEFTRSLLYRNFFDPYEREWRNGNSRWDLIDVLRLCYALRPDGINWPLDEQGVVSMRLEALTAANGIEHAGAHDALVDVRATIAVARLLKQKQPKLFDYALKLKDKKFAASLFDWQQHKPLLHTSGMFGAANHYTRLVMPLIQHPSNKNGVVVVDLSVDPASWLELSAEQMRERLYTRNELLAEQGLARVPMKTVHLNKSPMLAPPSLLTEQVSEKLGIDVAACERHWQQILAALPRITAVLNAVFDEQPAFEQVADPEFQLYGGFLSPADKKLSEVVRRASLVSLKEDRFPFEDARMNELLFRYRARNFAETLSPEEFKQWDEHCSYRLQHKISEDWLTRGEYLAKIAQLESTYPSPSRESAILQALKAWESELY